jgi:hypothetical protein
MKKSDSQAEWFRAKIDETKKSPDSMWRQAQSGLTQRRKIELLRGLLWEAENPSPPELFLRDERKKLIPYQATDPAFRPDHQTWRGVVDVWAKGRDGKPWAWARHRPCRNEADPKRFRGNDGSKESAFVRLMRLECAGAGNSKGAEATKKRMANRRIQFLRMLKIVKRDEPETVIDGQINEARKRLLEQGVKISHGGAYSYLKPLKK